MSKPFSMICLLISLVALALAASVYLQADAIADAAVSRREQALVEKLKPKVMQIMTDLDVEDELTNVTTLDELFAPLFRISTAIR